MKHRDNERKKQAKSDIYAAYITYTENLTGDKQRNIIEIKKVLEELYETGFGDNLKSGSDGITPEVLKRCEVSDIVLTFANRILTDN